MKQETKRALEHIKTQMLEATNTLSKEEKEEFYHEINDWTYGEYEKSLFEEET